MNTDISQRALMDSAEMDWVESPTKGVWRKRLYHDGAAESGRVSTIVRFDAGSRFPHHDHPEGEEILVLDGTFSDHTGDWHKGAWLLNPDGSPHAPHSAEGCTLFVHLRQYRGEAFKRVDTNTADWQPASREGIEQLVLLEESGGPDGPETIRLLRFAPGTKVEEHEHARGEEILVIDGELTDSSGTYGPGCWLRNPPGSRHSATSPGGCLLYARNGGLGLANKA
jgi:anti-sigma factor ChrR (cupin superfamily)